MQTFAPGMVLRDRYRLESVLGRGVMGQVWRGRDLYLERPVAVKTVASELLGPVHFGLENFQHAACSQHPVRGQRERLLRGPPPLLDRGDLLQ